MPLALIDAQQVIRATSATSQLLQLDELWTAAAATMLPPEETDDQKNWIDQLDTLYVEMHDLLELQENETERLAPIAQGHINEAEETLNDLLWSDVLSPSDRETLRWWIGRHGGFSGMVTRISAMPAEYSEERSALDQEMEVLRSGGASAGDLSKSFRCGLTQQLMVGGILAVPAAGAGGIGTAVTVGVVAGVAVGATGGVGAIAIIGLALLWAKRYRC